MAGGNGEVSMRAANSNSKDQSKTGPAQESAAPQNSAKNVSLALTTLTDCLVDADTAASARFGRGRRNAFGASALVQFCAICVLLIWPLFATGSRLIAKSTVVIPPYGGMPHADRAPASQQPSPPRDHGNHIPTIQNQIIAPTRIPPRIDEADDKDGGTNVPPSANTNGTGTNYSGPVGLIPIPDTNPTAPLPPMPITTAPTPRPPVRVSEGVVMASLIHRVEPIYPMIAKQIHLEGVVELRAIIARDGTVQQLEVVRGNAILALAARNAVIQWKFRPTLLNGEPIEVDTYFTVILHLGQ